MAEMMARMGRGSGGSWRGMSGYPGAPGAQGPGGTASAESAMIQLKVDPAKLPKAEDLRALMFPGTTAVTVDDQAIRLVTRESFPNLVSGIVHGSRRAVRCSRRPSRWPGTEPARPPPRTPRPRASQPPAATRARPSPVPASRAPCRRPPRAVARHQARPPRAAGSGSRSRPGGRGRVVAAPRPIDRETPRRATGNRSKTSSTSSLVCRTRERVAAGLPHAPRAGRAGSASRVAGPRRGPPAIDPPAGRVSISWTRPARDTSRPGIGTIRQRFTPCRRNAMEIVSEVTAHLENKPGRLAKICSALAQEKVDIRAITVMEADGPSVLRFVTTDIELTKKVLTSLGTEFRLTEVLAVGLENRTGALSKVLEKLAEEHINIDYAYASTASSQGKALGIFHTNNTKRALQILGESACEQRREGRRPPAAPLALGSRRESPAGDVP